MRHATDQWISEPDAAIRGSGARTSGAAVAQCLHMDADTRTCGRTVDSPYVELAVEVFSMLADATRVRIVLALREGELSVGRLAEIVDKSPAAVSQHLAKLRLARIVRTRQDGQRMFYSLANEHAVRLVTDAMQQAEHAVDEPHHHRMPARNGAER